MTATSIQVTAEGDSSLKVTASFVPQDYEVTDLSGAKLNMEIGYEFSGRVTIDPMPSSGAPAIETNSFVTASGFSAGDTMFSSVIPLPVP